MLEINVPENIKMPVGRFLDRAYPLFDFRNAFKKRDIKINGARASKDETVKTGDIITAYVNADTSIEITEGKNGLIAAVKPQGLSVDKDENGIAVDTAVTRVQAVYPSAKLCHRLDAMTGGVLVFALDDDSYEKARAAFKDHDIVKRYKAVCAGGFDKKRFVYSDALVKDAKASTVHIARPNERGMASETIGEVLIDNGKFALVELEPVTGRTHQLRAHLSYHKHPILGDDKYGDRLINRETTTRLKLWCEYINIMDCEFYAPAPFDDFVNRLII